MLKKIVVFVGLFTICLISGININAVKKSSKGLEYKLNDDGMSYTVTGIGTCTDENVIIPSKYNGKRVVIINFNAFEGNENIQSVTLPNTIEYIMTNSFSNCTNLKNITFSKGIKYIYDRAFYNCTALENVYFEGTIEDWCEIDFIFSKVEERIESGNPMYYAQHVYMKDDNGEQYELTELILPKSVRNIGSAQFHGLKSLSKVKIVDHFFISIDSYAFVDCKNLKSVTLSTKSITVKNEAFKGCTELIFYFDKDVNTKNWDKNWNCENSVVLRGVDAEFIESIGCKKDLSILVVGLISLLMIGVLIKKH